MSPTMPPNGPLRRHNGITVLQERPVVVLKMEGHFTLDSVLTIDEIIRSSMSGGVHSFVLDMIDVRDITSSVIGKLVALNRELQIKSGNMVLADLSPVCKYVLDLMDMQTYFPTFPTVEEAVRSIG